MFTFVLRTREHNKPFYVHVEFDSFQTPDNFLSNPDADRVCPYLVTGLKESDEEISCLVKLTYLVRSSDARLSDVRIT